MMSRRALPLLVISMVAALIVPSAAHASTADRIYGPDRFATAVAVSQNFSPGVPVVYVATGLNYPDALSAAPAAALQGGPLLLTQPNSLPGNVRDEISRLSPALIVVVGSAVAVSNTVYQQLSEIAPVRRDGGANRYETSRIVNERAFTGGATQAFIATGQNFPDALSASAAAGTTRSPVILVDGTRSTLDGPTVALLSDLGVSSANIAGSAVVVSDGIESELSSLMGGNVWRLAGPDRYATSAAINSAFFSSESVAYLAVGTGFADALAGAALAGVQGAPLFVVPGNCVPPAIIDSLESLGVSTHVLLGGPNVLDANVEALYECGSPPPPPSYPGDVVNCTDFSTQGEAQAWFNYYYPHYGDVAGLDSDNDLIACETLP